MVYKLAHEAEISSLPFPASGKLYDSLLEFLLVLDNEYGADRNVEQDDGGSAWTQVYQGGGLSATNTVPFGTESVMYRVRAYDSEGLHSSYRNSAQVTVTAPTATT